jgi:hypothetical protein
MFLLLHFMLAAPFIPINADNLLNHRRNTKIVSLVRLVVMVNFGWLHCFAWLSHFLTSSLEGESSRPLHWGIDLLVLRGLLLPHPVSCTGGQTF